MRINRRTAITNDTVLLVPYQKKHVEKYHQWMLSEELQHLTGSEPLTLEQEYEMQKSWQEDEDKCTFIILDPNIHGTSSGFSQEIESMVGDTNLYFNDPEEPKTAECEIMIAEERARGRKMGTDAMLAMFRYGIEALKVEKYRAKIKLDNSKSIALFNKFSFKEVSTSEVFQETTMEVEVSKEWMEWLISKTPKYRQLHNWNVDDGTQPGDEKK